MKKRKVNKKETPSITDLFDRYAKLSEEQKKDRAEIDVLFTESERLEDEADVIGETCDERSLELTELKDKIKELVDGLTVDFS